MKRFFTLFAVFWVVMISGVAKADLTPWNLTYSFDHDNQRLYNTFNSLFGMSVSSNNALLPYMLGEYEIPEAFHTQGSRAFAVSGTFGDDSVFTFYNAATGASLAGPTNTRTLLGSSNVGNVSASFVQNFANRSMWNGSSFNGDFYYRFTNSNPYGGTFYSNRSNFENVQGQGVNHFVYFDVTDLMQQRYSNLGFDYTSAYLVGYEDRTYNWFYDQNNVWDGDYNDFVFLIFKNDGTTSNVPEPATILLWTLGTFGVAGYSRRRSKKLRKYA